MSLRSPPYQRDPATPSSIVANYDRRNGSTPNNGNLAYTHSNGNGGGRDRGEEDLFLDLVQDNNYEADGVIRPGRYEGRHAHRGRPLLTSTTGESFSSPIIGTEHARARAHAQRYTRPSRINTSVSPKNASPDSDFEHEPPASAFPDYGRAHLEDELNTIDDYASRRTTIIGGTTPFISSQPSNQISSRKGSPYVSGLRNITEKSLTKEHLESRHRQAAAAPSVVSTNAASTVWDELDDLKSRIRTLEMTGNRPRYHGDQQASDLADVRPRTSTTHTTSTSYHSQSAGLSSTSVDHTRAAHASIADVQPLLQAALAKVEHTVSDEVYRALEATAIDALQLSGVSRGREEGARQSLGNTVGASLSITERRMQRKADNLCRSLTELCIVLCEQSRGHTSDSKQFRVNGLSLADQSPLTYLDQQRRQPDRIGRSSSTPRSRERWNTGRRDSSEENSAGRVPSRERGFGGGGFPTGRRPSLPLEATIGRGYSSEFVTGRSVARAATTNTRPSTYARSDVHASGEDDYANFEDDNDPTISGLPRAMTEVQGPTFASLPAVKNLSATATKRTHSPRDLRVSKDITSRNPLPEASPLLGKHQQNADAHNIFSSQDSEAPSTTSQRTATGPVAHGHTNLSSNGSSSRPNRSRAVSSSPDRRAMEGNNNVNKRSEGLASAPPPAWRPPGAVRPLPPSSAGLAERLDAKRAQRAAIATIGLVGAKDSPANPSKAPLAAAANEITASKAAPMNASTFLAKAAAVDTATTRLSTDTVGKADIAVPQAVPVVAESSPAPVDVTGDAAKDSPAKGKDDEKKQKRKSSTHLPSFTSRFRRRGSVHN